jgi:hypothetical protein
MEFKPKLNWSSTYTPIKNKEVIKKESGLNVSDRKEFKKKNKKEYILPCFQLWKSPIINWDGKLIGCCLNFNMDFGNVFEKGLDKCLKNKKYIYTKKFLIGKKKLTKKIPCFYCSKKESIFKKNIIKRGLILK